MSLAVCAAVADTSPFSALMRPSTTAMASRMAVIWSARRLRRALLRYLAFFSLFGSSVANEPSHLSLSPLPYAWTRVRSWCLSVTESWMSEVSVLVLGNFAINARSSSASTSPSMSVSPKVINV